MLSIKQRLEKPELSRVERLQRESFVRAISSLDIAKEHALSVSCGDGIWDYIAFKNTNIKKIIATDVVPCPVKQEDRVFLQKHGSWDFVQVQPDSPLPFESDMFDVVWSQDVIEHTERPYLFLREQYRVLRGGGRVITGTPNLLRPANIIKACLGRLKFPVTIGRNKEIGEYIHVQEFHECQLKLLLEEVGFVQVSVRHIFFGIHLFGLRFEDYPSGNFGKIFAHFLLGTGRKPEAV